ncbi:MAG: hypothetical protein PHF25_05500 [Candidatus Margulisbacteria bacterium]|nr:hypothetical protein [Candidatus Margulisiibacteriota bacterium]
MMDDKTRHVALSYKINEMMRHYDELPPETREEILRFFKTPERLTALRLNPFRYARQQKAKNSLFIMV